jgi:hypothetical protein
MGRQREETKWKRRVEETPGSVTKKETLHRGKRKIRREKEWVDGTGRRDGGRKTQIKRPVLLLFSSLYI